MEKEPLPNNILHAQSIKKMWYDALKPFLIPDLDAKDLDALFDLVTYIRIRYDDVGLLKIGDFDLDLELGRVGIVLTKTGAIIDPRTIRALTSSDIVTVNNLLNPHPVSKSGTWNIDNLLNPHPVSLASIPNPSNLDVALSTRATGTLLNPHPVIKDLTTGRTVIGKTGSLVTTAVTADQVILTYTVTGGKTFYLEYFRVDTRLTSFATTATYFGMTSLENPSGTKLITQMQAGAGITIIPPIDFTEPIPIGAGTVIRVVCTPSSTTSYTWQANFGGYEK